MASSDRARQAPWWQRRGPSGLVFLAVVATMLIVSVALWSSVADVLPDIGKDQQGDDPWEDPIGVEKVGEFHLARIPDCAAGPVVRIELWDEDSTPYWQVVGNPTPLETFAVGVPPEGFFELEAFKPPPPGAILRLVVVRSVKGVAGVRYRSSDLREGYVVKGVPPDRYEIDDFKTGDVCGNAESDADEGGTSSVPSTTIAGG